MGEKDLVLVVPSPTKGQTLIPDDFDNNLHQLACQLESCSG